MVQSQMAWFQVPAPPTSSCVTSSESLNLSGPLFPIFQMRIIVVATSEICCSNEMSGPGRVAQSVRASSQYTEVVGSTLRHNTCPGCGFSPQSGHVWETTNGYFFLTAMFLSLSLSPHLPLFLQSTNTSSGKDKNFITDIH